jgi:hypothetical protein
MSGTILTGLLTINGSPVPLCPRFCDKPDGTLCGRPANHPYDEYGHICEDCAAERIS